MVIAVIDNNSQHQVSIETSLCYWFGEGYCCGALTREFYVGNITNSVHVGDRNLNWPPLVQGWGWSWLLILHLFTGLPMIL